MKLSEIPTDKPINLICHRDDVVIKNDRSDVVSIEPSDTIAYSNALSAEDWTQLKASTEFMRLFRLVFTDIELLDHPLQSHGHGVRHVVGLILLTLDAMRQGKRPFWRFPESHLHPRSQLGLADLVVALTNSRKE